MFSCSAQGFGDQRSNKCTFLRTKPILDPGWKDVLPFDFVSGSISSCDCRLGFARVLLAYLFRVAAVGRGHLETATCGLQAQHRKEVLKRIKMDLKVV